MGLDMYLDEEIYIGGEFEHRQVKGTVDIYIRDKKVDIPLNRIASITLRAGYWRKANQIHNWFVENVQGGIDDCQKVYVSTEDLEKLRDTCRKVLENKKLASELLPTQSGFFFGGTEYNEFYFEDLEYTIIIIDECLKSKNGKFYYHSSW